MKYLYAKDQNFEDFASGRVIYTRPGQPAFPVRLASEIFQRGLVLWQQSGGSERCTLYDPTCGGAYWLVVLAYLHWDQIANIFASDITMDAITLAERNISLLTTSGLENRINKLQNLRSLYGKESHADALKSARRFHQKLDNCLKSHKICTKVFQANSMDPQAIRQGLGSKNVDIVLADVPYGWHSNWDGQVSNRETAPIQQMLSALSPWLRPTTVIAVATDKLQRVKHPGFQRISTFQVGKRRIVYLQPRQGFDFTTTQNE